MSHSTLRRMALGATILALIMSIGTLVIVISSWMGMTSRLTPIAATAVMVLTLGLQLIFLGIQAFRNGRAPIAIKGMGSDAWNTVIVMTAIPGGVWHQLAALALPPMQLVMPGFVTPIFNVVLFIVLRELQKRRDGVRA